MFDVSHSSRKVGKSQLNEYNNPTTTKALGLQLPMRPTTVEGTQLTTGDRFSVGWLVSRMIPHSDLNPNKIINDINQPALGAVVGGRLQGRVPN